MRIQISQCITTVANRNDGKIVISNRRPKTGSSTTGIRGAREGRKRARSLAYVDLGVQPPEGGGRRCWRWGSRCRWGGDGYGEVEEATEARACRHSFPRLPPQARPASPPPKPAAFACQCSRRPRLPSFRLLFSRLPLICSECASQAGG